MAWKFKKGTDNNGKGKLEKIRAKFQKLPNKKKL